MPKVKKCFIDKKNAVTFQLVHRSQKDPLITDETAPQHVLLDTTNPRNVPSETREQKIKRKEEERKYGIFFDDEYDYMQHLRVGDDRNAVHWEFIPPANLKNKAPATADDADVKSNLKENNGITLNLPSSVFASEYEEDEGLLRKAAPHSGPRPDLNPDIVAALDDDFNFDNPDNQLEDNFMEMAMGGECDDDDDDDDGEYSDVDSEFGDDDYSGDEDGDRFGPLRGQRKFANFDGEETKSRFTEYSMSSSVIRRNEQLALLDDRFEKFFEYYDEPEIGALDCEEIEGHIEMSDDLLSQCMVELKRDDNDLKYDRKWDEQRIKKIIEEASSDEETVEIEVENDDPTKKWDCESVLSTYSNLYNHPKLINEPRRQKSKIVINPKTGVPTNVFNGENSQLTLKSLAKFNTENTNGNAAPKSLCDQSVLSTLSVLSIRPSDETADEKKQRKRLLKEYRNERRIERKANTLAFKDEKKRQNEINMNNRNNIQGNRIL